MDLTLWRLTGLVQQGKATGIHGTVGTLHHGKAEKSLRRAKESKRRGPRRGKRKAKPSPRRKERTKENRAKARERAQTRKARARVANLRFSATTAVVLATTLVTAGTKCGVFRILHQPRLHNRAMEVKFKDKPHCSNSRLRSQRHFRVPPASKFHVFHRIQEHRAWFST